MANSFHRTTRALAGETSALAMLVWAVALVCLAAWMAWFVFGRVTTYQVSRAARLEVKQSAHPVTAAVAGKLAVHRMVIGQEVRAGDVLIQLDASREKLRLDEEASKLAGYGPKITSLNREIASLSQALTQQSAAADAAINAARSRVREATAGIDFAKDNERRLREESKVGGVPPVDALRASADVQKAVAAREALVAEVARAENEAFARRSQQEAHLENLSRSVVSLASEQLTTQATISRLKQEVDQFVVRAPVDGVIGEAAPLRVGAYVTAGQQVATVVPRGGMVVVADFAPAAVLGRLHPGQRGRLRLDGFPWTEFGSVEVAVNAVSSEIRDNLVRVELTPLPTASVQFLMQHGLPGAVEMAIEQVSPAMLVLRAMGQVSAQGLLSGPSTRSATP